MTKLFVLVPDLFTSAVLCSYWAEGRPGRRGGKKMQFSPAPHLRGLPNQLALQPGAWGQSATKFGQQSLHHDGGVAETNLVNFTATSRHVAISRPGNPASQDRSYSCRVSAGQFHSPTPHPQLWGLPSVVILFEGWGSLNFRFWPRPP